MKAWRIILVVAGVLTIGYGGFRFLTEIPLPNLIALAFWLGGAILVHDGVLSPAVVGIGVLLRRSVPDRARRHLQFALITAGLVTVVAVPMIYLRGSQPSVKALLLRDYGANLTVIIAIIAVTTLGFYAVRVARDRGDPTAPRGSPTE